MLSFGHYDLIDWSSKTSNIKIATKPVKPVALNHENWPPNYVAIYAWRIKQLEALRKSPQLLAHAKAYYSTRPVEFIMHWMDTYDPRKKANKWFPFVFFKKQAEFIDFLHACRFESQNGLVEKCRDMGATWLACAYTIWSWIFIKNDAIGWGSRKQDLVHKIGNPDSIFEKMKLLLDHLPEIWLPTNYNSATHATFMRFLNPENGSVIVGEAGDNIGRGGRTSIYFKDEAAYYERPEKIEAALGDNTNVQIDISSVNGLGNVFHRRRENGIQWISGKKIEPGYTRVFIFDWTDHPNKTKEWYNEKRSKFEREGMLHLFAQEVERNYSAAIQNTLIPMEWLQAAVDSHKKIKWIDNKGNVRIGYEPANNWMAALDVADGGIDRNALAIRQDIVLREIDEWGERDPGVTARKTIVKCRDYPRIKVQYDNIGIGASVKSEFNRLIDEGASIARFVGWNAGGAVIDPFERLIPDDEDSILNRDMFANMKAQAWWSVRTRAYKTFMNVVHGVACRVDETISLDSTMPLLHQAMKELAQPTKGENSKLKVIVNKKPEGTKSPNLGDAIIMAFFPVPEDEGIAVTGRYGG